MLFLLVWVVCLAEDEDLFLESLLFKKYLHKSLLFFSLSSVFIFCRLPGKAFQTVFDQHPDSLVRVVQVCYKKKRFWFLTLRKPRRFELRP